MEYSSEQHRVLHYNGLKIRLLSFAGELLHLEKAEYLDQEMKNARYKMLVYKMVDEMLADDPTGGFARFWATLCEDLKISRTDVS